MNANEESELVELLHVISHDFRAPVRHLKEFSKLLFHENPPEFSEEQDQFKNYIEESIDILDTQLERMLIYSRLNTRPDKVTLTLLHDILTSSITHLTETDQPRIKISFENDIDENLEIKTRPNIASMALKEIINNALIFSNKKDVHINVRRRNTALIVKVVDEGIGIPSTKLQGYAFKVFSRLNHSNDFPGVGMGLPIAKKALGKINGKIGIEQNIERGITATITIENCID